MARTLITARFQLANGNPAASLTVSVLEGRRTLATGQTDATGWFAADISPHVPWNTAPSRVTPAPATPRRLRVQDALPNFFETALRSNLNRPHTSYVLPPAFNPQPAEPPSNPNPVAGSDADTVNLAVQKPISPSPGTPFSTVNDAAPGHVMCIRKNGSPWVSVTRGLSRLARQGINQRAMTDDTIISIASMSKPLTATAVVAMIDDWAAIRADFFASQGAGAPMTPLQVSGQVMPLQVPTVLAPLFSDTHRAQEFFAYVPSGIVADEVKNALLSFKNGTLTVTGTLPLTPPGYFGLLKRGVGGAAPAFSDPVWPLIQHRLSAGFSAEPHAAALTIEQFLVHMSGYRDFDDGSMPDGTVPAPIPVQAQPPGQRASFDLWGFIAGLMVRTPKPGPGFHYANMNPNVLTALVEACTETSFDDYLTNRLFFDLRFDNLRRHVVDTHRCALYYAGTQQSGFSGGTLFSDFTDWPGNGGMYVTANQFTDWLYALFARQPVARRGSAVPQPMVSNANFTRLFSTSGPGFPNISTNSPFFGVGLRKAGPLLASNRFQENGGAGSVGFVAGNLAIIVAPSGSIYTAFFVANGNLNPVGGADGPWEAVVAALPWN